MSFKVHYLAKSGKKFYLAGFPEHLYLDEKYRAIRFESYGEALDMIILFGKNHKIPYQYTFTIKEEITIEDNNQTN